MRANLEAPKAIVFISCLLSLFRVCSVPSCHSAIDAENVHVHDVGAVVTVKWSCNANHCGEWHSSPYVGTGRSKVGVLNIMLATYSLTCGLHITQVWIAYTKYI